MNIKTYGPDEKWSNSVILPIQTHSNNIVEIVTGNEDLSNCDGIWTRFHQPPLLRGYFELGIKTADCAPIVFWDDNAYGIVHAGWRGLCNGIIEKMLANFEDKSSDPGVNSFNDKIQPRGQIFNIWIGPILPKFEIQKDFCYDEIYAKFGDQFFSKISPRPTGTPLISRGGKAEKYLFDFKGALKSILPMAEFDERSTYKEGALASWRRDQDEKRNLTVIS